MSGHAIETSDAAPPFAGASAEELGTTPETSGGTSGGASSSAATSVPAVRLRGLTHGWSGAGGERRVLDAVDLEVDIGETVALIGRSGSGKSTLLNLIGGLEPVRDGEVFVFGESLGALDDRARTLLRRRSIGFVHQAFNLVPTLTVGDNVTLPLALAGTPSSERAERLSALLASVGLDGRANDHPDTLSGGEQQRVAIARALIHRPPLLLADEPTGNLDAESGRRVLALLTDLVERQDTAMLLVTHSLEVARVADRALGLSDGSLVPLDAEALTAGGVW